MRSECRSPNRFQFVQLLWTIRWRFCFFNSFACCLGFVGLVWTFVDDAIGCREKGPGAGDENSPETNRTKPVSLWPSWCCVYVSITWTTISMLGFPMWRLFSINIPSILFRRLIFLQLSLEHWKPNTTSVNGSRRMFHVSRLPWIGVGVGWSSTHRQRSKQSALRFLHSMIQRIDADARHCAHSVGRTDFLWLPYARHSKQPK